MKLNNSNTITRTTSNNSDYQVSTIPNEEISTVAMLLSQMYSKPRHAVIRELVSNGIDAVVAEGSKRPVILTLPSVDEPKLTVTDYGTGMSHEEVLSILVDYSISTKRDDNQAIGRIGIGSKSPYAISSQYVVETTKNNETTIVSMALMTNDDGMPTPGHKILFHDKKSQKPNGTIVTIPVVDNTDEESWVNIAAEVLFHFPKDTIKCYQNSKLIKINNFRKIRNKSWSNKAISIMPQNNNETTYLKGKNSYTPHKRHQEFTRGYLFL